MNKISPLDIRVAVLAYPFVKREEEGTIATAPRPFLPFNGDERIVSLFQNSPKALIEPSPSFLPPLIRKGQFAWMKVMEVLRSFLAEKEKTNVLADVAPPRRLLVPQLPHPPFKATKPPRFFWHPAYTAPEDEGYAPSCLMSESKDDLPTEVYCSPAICAHAKAFLSQNGVLRQDHEGFVYLELSDDWITELYALINDPHSEAMPLYHVEPSPSHIPVILPHEWEQRKGWGELAELGESFTFEIKRLYAMQPGRWPGVDRVYFFSISCPELERLRERCLLPSRIRGHDFHIAIACTKAKANAPAPAKETFRLNVSCFAA